MIRGKLAVGGAKWRTVSMALFLLTIPGIALADDPMNKPLDSVGVSGYDKNLCNDKWNTCSEYDRSQFDTKYPGSPLEGISLYPLSERRQTLDGAGLSEDQETEQQGDDSSDNGEE